MRSANKYGYLRAIILFEIYLNPINFNRHKLTALNKIIVVQLMKLNSLKGANNAPVIYKCCLIKETEMRGELEGLAREIARELNFSKGAA